MKQEYVKPRIKTVLLGPDWSYLQIHSQNIGDEDISGDGPDDPQWL